VRISSFYHTLFGKAFGIFLGVVGVCCAILAIALSFKLDLDRQYRELSRLSEREAELQLHLLVASDLIVDLTTKRGDGVPEKATLLEWRGDLQELAGLEQESSFGRRLQLPDLTLRKALVDLEQLLDAPGEEELDRFAARLLPALKMVAVEVESRLGEAQLTRRELERSYQREADTGALWMLGVGLSGFTAVCLLAGRFFIRLARDLRRLERRAEQIAGGDFGERVVFSRRDEVGELGEGVNRMAEALAEREGEVAEFRDRLFRADKTLTLGSFAAGIAHEIGNPIQAMSAICEQVSTSLADDPSKDNVEASLERMEMIVHQIERIGTVIRDVNDFARPGTAEMEPTSINQLIESAIRLLRFDRRFRRITLRTDLSSELPMVRAVGEHLTQIAINTLLNAADAIEGPEGEIVVTTRLDGGDALISIADNGRGMSKEDAKNALDPFFTTKSRGKGTGLGLAVCQTIVDEHGGSVEIESEPERGTVVRIRIPVAPEGTAG
jgi:signal transduction histidine kinase